MEMITKVQEMVTSSKAELENTIQNISKQYDGFAQQIRNDIQKSEDAMEVEINKFIAENKPQAGKVKQCKLEKDKAVTKLKEETDKELLVAKTKFDKKIDEVDKCIQKSLEKLTQFYTEAQENVTKIIEKNKANPMTIPDKLAEQVEPLQKKFTVIREDVAKTLKTNYEKSQSVLKELESNVNTIEGHTKKKYTDIVQKFKDCVDKK